MLEHELEPAQSVSEMMSQIWSDMPADVRAAMPRDGASQNRSLRLRVAKERSVIEVFPDTFDEQEIRRSSAPAL